MHKMHLALELLAYVVWNFPPFALIRFVIAKGTRLEMTDVKEKKTHVHFGTECRTSTNPERALLISGNSHGRSPFI